MLNDCSMAFIKKGKKKKKIAHVYGSGMKLDEMQWQFAYGNRQNFQLELPICFCPHPIFTPIKTKKEIISMEIENDLIPLSKFSVVNCSEKF